ncbi:hypothetical protein BFP72_04395 [Reichenbachiella sp. 5M10]|uniref:SdpI family protein n=1 Tax=Reichenbachiella sp. 5M10 TaxID=1889772 RepID=UPI000C153465|nr:SdpI family protein [Reichenbachiella sp. 5M10]PIB34700.1 hypothetical protein BFP72_04395 [Reichenbachiella sp. 5M10]
MKNFKKEGFYILITLLPILYLGVIYETLPEQVPVHWNIQGEVDRYGSRLELFIIASIGLFTYLTFAIMPLIDPKKKIQQMGGKFNQLRNLLTLLMTILTGVILYSIQHPSLSTVDLIFVVIGAIFFVFGNYFQTVKANYFIGIRTPWTLENETVWKNTHRLGGKIWFAGGLVIICTSLLFNAPFNMYAFIGITLLITLIPVVYSYVDFKRITKPSS